MKLRIFQVAQFGFLLLIIALMLITGCNDGNQTDIKRLRFDPKKAQAHVMKLEEALSYTARFKSSRRQLDATLSNTDFFKKNPIRLLNGEYFNRDAIIALLNQADSGGIRIYLGQDANGTVKFILVPATEKKDYLVKLVAFNSFLTPGSTIAQPLPYADGEVMERGGECPTMCPEDSPFSRQR